MDRGRRLALLVTALVLCASGAVLLGATTAATVARPVTASGRHAARGAQRASRPARLVLPHAPLTTADAVPVTVINASASTIYRSLCFVLERRTSHGSTATRRSHTAPVACTRWPAG